MDAFALARRRAREIRERVAGIVGGYDAAVQALAKEGLGVIPVPRDGPLLAGDAAQLRRDFSRVLVRDDVGEEEQAVLLAHELGHKVLHRPHERCELEHGEAAGSRVLARVETYGPRERRELQANVFAREFLLPRDQARRLFLGERLPATEIALRLRLPLREVRRQLLDALLRPDDSPQEDEAAPAAIRLDDSQAAAVDHVGRALLVEAGPGSGKTRTLVSRVERRLSEDVHPAHVLALTFSNKAAAELSQRIAERRPDDAVEVWAGTFHAFGLEVMRQFYDRLDLSPIIRLVSPSQAVEMLEDQLPLLGLKHFHDLRDPGARLKDLLKPIQRAKDELVGPERFRELAVAGHAQAVAKLEGSSGVRTKALLEAARKAVVAAEKTLEAATVYEVYDQMLRQAGWVDYGDLVMRPTLLMETDGEVRAALRDRHREILVDEYQDVNRACARMLQALYGPANTLWVVGDARQSIYRFRGASPLNMDRFEKDFEGADRKALGWNYRSTDHLVGLARRFARAMDERLREAGIGVKPGLPYEAQSKRPDAGTPTKVSVGRDDECEADLVAQQIQLLQAGGVPLAGQTVLARTNGRLDTLAAQLAARGLPVLHLGSFFEREEVRDLLSVLALVSEANGAALVRVAASREFGAHASDIALVMDEARRREVPAAAVLPGADAIEGMSPEGGTSLARLGRRLAGLGPRTPAFEVAATWLLERSDHLRDLSEADGVQGELSRAALWQVVKFLDQADPDGRPLSAQEALRRVRTVILMADDRDLREPALGPQANAVRMMTVHAAKGLEFQAVHVVGLHEGGFPLTYRTNICQPPPGIEDGSDPRTAHGVEEDCTFFVAASRAQDHLRLYRTEVAKVQGRTASRFLKDLPPCPEEHLAGSSPPLSSKPAAAEPIPIDALTLQDLRDHEQCPLRLAYRHGMRIRGRRYEGPFLKASGVLYELLDDLGRIAADVAVAMSSFDHAWAARGPVGHSLEAEYKALVRHGLTALLDAARGFNAPPTRTVLVPVPGGHVEVPAPLLSPGTGRGRMARYVELGRGDPSHAKGLRAGMLHAAAVVAAEESVSVEIVYLRGATSVPLARTADEAHTAALEAGEILETVRGGRLEPSREMRVCRRCAHFYSCPAVGMPRPT